MMATAHVAVEQLVYLTDLIGLRVEGPNGQRIGRVREAALAPSEHPRRVSRFLVGSGRPLFMVRHDQITAISFDGIRLSDDRFVPYYPDESLLLLDKDLLDQQIVDVNGRKVVRVNDVALRIERVNAHDELWVQEVGVGMQGAFRRLFQGWLSPAVIRKLQNYFPPNSIRWEYCNIIEPDPRRRLKLRISHDRLGQLHPADLADIVEELAPEERGALFETLNDRVAAETLTEIEPAIQRSIVASLDEARAADVIEEMDPDNAADLLNALQDERSQAILRDMEQEPAAEVEELLDYGAKTAGGLMNSQFIALHENATTLDALEALQGAENHIQRSLTHIFLIDEDEKLVAAVPLGRVVAAPPGAPLRRYAFRETVKVGVDENRNEVIYLFDNYNLLTLPVVDPEGKLEGVITADDVISLLHT